MHWAAYLIGAPMGITRIRAIDEYPQNISLIPYMRLARLRLLVVLIIVVVEV